MKILFVHQHLGALVSSIWPEPFGMTGPEATRYALPVVAFDAGDIRECPIDAENGCLLPWINTKQSGANIEKLLLDKYLARRMGRNGMERVNREYDSNRQMDDLKLMFRKATGELPAYTATTSAFQNVFANQV
jgi:glycosyltransferase involved in cell wall biosynthesis